MNIFSLSHNRRSVYRICTWFFNIIPFENLDQFILKFGVIYLITKLNVLSSIDATRWKLVFYSIEIIVLDGIHPTSPYDGLHTGGEKFLTI